MRAQSAVVVPQSGELQCTLTALAARFLAKGAPRLHATGLCHLLFPDPFCWLTLCVKAKVSFP